MERNGERRPPAAETGRARRMVGMVLLAGVLAVPCVHFGAGKPPSIHRFSPDDSETCNPCHEGSAPDTSSAFCIQCHDGTIAGGVHLSSLGVGNPFGIHPVGLRLIPGHGLRIPEEGTGVRLLGLEKDSVECLSCHYAHDKGTGMTVAPSGGRDLCTQCHIK